MHKPRLFIAVALAAAVWLALASPGSASPPLGPPQAQPSPSPRPKATAPGPVAPPIDEPSPTEAKVPEGTQYEPRTVDITTPPPGTRRLTLQESIDTGLRVNPRMKTAAERTAMARARYQEVQSARNPRLQVDNETTFQNSRSVQSANLFPNGQIPVGFSETLDVVKTVQNQTHAYVQWLLTTFGRVENQVAAAFINIAVAARDAESERRQLLYDIKTAYFARLQAEATVMVSELNLEAAERNRKDTEARFKYGLLARYDYIQAQLEVTTAKRQLEDARAAQGTSNARLKALLLDHADSPLWAVPPQPIQFDDRTRLSDLQQVAMVRRPDVQSLNLSLAAAKRILSAARADNAPTLGLQLNWYNQVGNNLLPDHLTNFAIAFQWPLFDGGLRNARVRQAQSNLRTLEANIEQLRESILQQVEDAWLLLLRDRQDYRLALEKVELAAVFYTLARARYIRGVGTSLEMQNALTNLNSARLSVVVANNTLDRAFASLEQSLGTDFPDRHLVIPPPGPPDPRISPPLPSGSGTRSPVPSPRAPAPSPSPPVKGGNAR